MNIDFLLIQKMKHGDESAFDIFISKHYEEILKYCNYHCLDASYAEDLTQETFLHFFERLSDYRYMGKTRNYLYTIAGNLCRNYYKKIKERLLEDTSIEARDSFEHSEADKVLNKITVEAALNTLPDELREVVVLYYFQELKLAEISEILQIGLPLVKYRMKQAKMRLEQLLKEE